MKFLCCSLWLALVGASLAATDATRPGTPASPFPTLHNLSVEWPIEGDANGNGRVAVRYRARGESTWREAMPLRRVRAGRRDDLAPGFSWENKHAGSIFNLAAGVEYEIALELHDPDGGDARETVRATTRSFPQAMPDAPRVRVNPKTLRAAVADARPGTIFLLAPGNYGYFAVESDGAPGRPLIFLPDKDAFFQGYNPPARSKANRGDALFEGISLQNRRHVILRGLVSQGTIDLLNARECVIQGCRIYGAFGIVSSYTGNLAKWAPSVAARLAGGPRPELWGGTGQPRTVVPPHAANCVVTDNTIVGMTPWTSEAQGPSGKNIGEGIELSGPGNVIAFNHVRGFRDGISTVEGHQAAEQTSIDIHNNDIAFATDDGIEADFCWSNCRIYQNRLTNCFVGLSSQPALGGPVYFIRNVQYNTLVNAFKFHRGSDGNVVLHNTVVKTGPGLDCVAGETWSHTVLYNNLGVGGAPDAAPRHARLAAYFPGADATCDFDHNGFGAAGLLLAGNIAGVTFAGIEAMRTTTTEKHGVHVGLDVFAESIQLPVPQFEEWRAPRLTLRAGSAAIDAGRILPNINDGFEGAAPDLGAYEAGVPPPHYGPRDPARWDDIHLP